MDWVVVIVRLSDVHCDIVAGDSVDFQKGFQCVYQGTLQYVCVAHVMNKSPGTKALIASSGDHTLEDFDRRGHLDIKTTDSIRGARRGLCLGGGGWSSYDRTARRERSFSIGVILRWLSCSRLMAWPWVCSDNQCAIQKKAPLGPLLMYMQFTSPSPGKSSSTSSVLHVPNTRLCSADNNKDIRDHYTAKEPFERYNIIIIIAIPPTKTSQSSHHTQRLPTIPS